MNENKIIMPTKKEVIAMLDALIKLNLNLYQNIGEVLGVKLIEDRLPKMKGEPQWGYEGFKVFCKEIQRGLDGAIVEIDDYVLENIQRLLDESLVKEEYYIVQNITRRLGEIFINFLNNSLDMIHNNSDTKDVEKTLEKY